MPYIKAEQRPKIDLFVKDLAEVIDDVGELNYALTTLCLKVLSRAGASYSTYNGILGVLECVKQELYRMKIAPYEDLKRHENGDV